MQIQKSTQKNDSRSCINECFSPRSTPIAMKALVPVLPRASENPSRCSLIVRLRFVRNARHEGLSSSSFITRFPGETSHCNIPAVVTHLQHVNNSLSYFVPWLDDFMTYLSLVRFRNRCWFGSETGTSSTLYSRFHRTDGPSSH